MESLFIDEAFGALDADSLDLVIASLDALCNLGRQVGVISHVGILVERIGVKVQVYRRNTGFRFRRAGFSPPLLGFRLSGNEEAMFEGYNQAG